MRHGEWELSHDGGSLRFGLPDLGIWNRTTPVIGSADIRSSDADQPRRDGRAFGRDFFSGQSVSFDLVARGVDGPAVRRLVEDARLAWRADPVRSTPGAAAMLRSSYHGRERVIFGRPRNWAADYRDATTNNLISIQCDFACIDDVFYGAATESHSVTIAAGSGGGLIAPLVAPLTTTRSSDRSSVVSIDSELPVWPLVIISGPVSNPVVVIGGVRFEARLTLAYDQVLTIDARPWARTVTRDGVSVAGALRGTRLAEASLPAGEHEFTLSGTDSTGTATATLSWRSGYTTL